MRAGFIGLGNMGLPMARRIRSEGHDLTLYARRRASLEPFADTDGVTFAATPAELGAAVDAVGICVFDAAGVEEVLFGPDGLAGALRAGSVVLVHSTLSPAQIRRIAERAEPYGLRILDAPVSGGQDRALAGELTIMVGGDAEALADVSGLLSALSRHVVHLGGVGAGSYAKLVNNTLFAAQIALTDDAMRAGETLGIDLAGLADILTTSSSACVASGVRLRAGSLAGIAGTPADATLTKDVTLTADLLADAPGSELVHVARRFVTGMRASDLP
ncbi:NAD(P)-dependent oxidoreductase [Streptomyces sp. WI04-05B]|uniref:NAD(P)-dependent oxidoreductase n=1 Tax=Streptomyces TaxID=1883 RepID=UPI0029A80CCA|nr:MULTISPECIES: NAD(P)-dependent oxidoreductase [unclassified Streptomyces]MDX2544703.1 NAD(P)-dependent oxidoreductase [Streptomyces sp. WI04-05B]MDX2588771.1 NAD(P)-dependent oxidoreductase [Streptomyces sp. WI04-05A]